MSALIGAGDRFATLAALLLALLVVGHLVVAVLARPQRGLLLLAALLPFDGLLLIVPGGDQLGPWKEALLVAVLAATFVAPDSARRQARTPLPGWVLVLAAFVLLGAVSAVVVGGLVGLVGFKVTFFYVLVPWILWRCPVDRTERDRLVTILMATGFVTAVVGIAQQLAGAERLNAMGYEYNTAIRFAGGLLRSFSTFTQPFSFALFVAMVLLVCLPVAMSQPRRTRNTLFLAVSPVLAVGMATSVVRSAYLAVVVGLVFLALWRYRGLAHLLVPAGLAALVLPGTVSTAFLSASSLGQRTEGWTLIFERVLAAPLGNGLGVTSSAAEKALELGADPASVITLDGQAYQPDNYYVKTVLELGPLGLWLLLLLGAAALVTALRLAHQIRGKRQRVRGRGGSLPAGSRGCGDGLDVPGDLPARLLLLAPPGGAPVLRPAIDFNALALRPGGSGVQTYIRELLRALSGLTEAALAAHVQADAVGELPASVAPVPHAVADGVRRAASGLLLRSGPALLHGLDVDLPLRLGGPSVTTVHDLSVFDVPWAHGRLRARGERALVARAIRRADAVVSVSEFTASRVQALFGRPSTVTHLAPAPVMAPAPPETVAEVRRRYGLPEHGVLFVGTLEPRKRVDLLAAACTRAGLPLVLAGGVAAGEQVPATAQHLGYVAIEDLPALYAAADVVAYASTYEGFGLPPVEAMACGGAVVATAAGAVPEVVGDGAVVVPPDDEEALAAALRGGRARPRPQRRPARRGGRGRGPAHAGSRPPARPSRSTEGSACRADRRGGAVPRPAEERAPGGLLANSGALMASRLVKAALGWAGTVLIARSLSLEQFGAFTLIFTVLGLMSVVTDMGIGRIAIRGMLGDRGRDPGAFAGSYIALRSVMGLVGYLVALLVVLALRLPDRGRAGHGDRGPGGRRGHPVPRAGRGLPGADADGHRRRRRRRRRSWCSSR